MTRSVKKTSTPSITPNHSSIARRVRGIITSLALPSIITACAPVPHIHPSSGASANTQGGTVLYVKRPESQPETTEAIDAASVAQAPEEMGPPLPPSSPANKYVPLIADVPIYTKINSKAMVGPPAPTAEQKAQAAASVARIQTPKINTAQRVAFKSLKDGIWDRVRKRLMLTAFDQESVNAEVDKIRRSPGGLNSISKRAEPFLFYIVDEIDRRGLPMDLVMVPMVESAFEPSAVSPKQAAGIWQIIPGTATENGLKLVDGYDGRFDVYASTKAALKYLSRLQGMFGGDWLLALAAYNAGEGAVQRAIQANQKAGLGTSFWDLNLPAETKAYVPKILALSRVIGDPLSHGVQLPKISPLPYLARVEMNSSVNLGEAVAALGMSWGEFAGMNPAFKPDVAPASTSYNVLLPLEKAQMLVASLQGSKLISARKYVVKKGETLKVIAKQEGVPALKLAEWNGLKADSPVKAGQELIIFPA